MVCRSTTACEGPRIPRLLQAAVVRAPERSRECVRERQLSCCAGFEAGLAFRGMADVGLARGCTLAARELARRRETARELRTQRDDPRHRVADRQHRAGSLRALGHHRVARRELAQAVRETVVTDTSTARELDCECIQRAIVRSLGRGRGRRTGFGWASGWAGAPDRAGGHLRERDARAHEEEVSTSHADSGPAA